MWSGHIRPNITVLSPFLTTVLTTKIFNDKGSNLCNILFLKYYIVHCSVCLSAPDAHMQLWRSGAAVMSSEKPKQQYHGESTKVGFPVRGFHRLMKMYRFSHVTSPMGRAAPYRLVPLIDTDAPVYKEWRRATCR